MIMTWILASSREQFQNANMAQGQSRFGTTARANSKNGLLIAPLSSYMALVSPAALTLSDSNPADPGTGLESNGVQSELSLAFV